MGAVATAGQRSRLLAMALAVITVASLLQARRYHLHGEEFSAMLTIGFLSTVISPISWSHHLAWGTLAGLYLLLSGSRAAGLAVLAMFVVGTPFIVYFDTLPFWYVIAGELSTLSLICFAVFGLPRRSKEPSPEYPPAVALA